MVPGANMPTISTQIIKKLFWVALYTSPVIAALLITPVSIINRSLLRQYPLSLLTVTAAVLFMWAVNILIIFFVSKSKKNNAFSLTKYFLSYFICVLFIMGAVEWFFVTYMHPGEDVHKKIFHFHLIVFVSINTAILIIQDLVLVKEKNILIALENARLRVKNMEAVNRQLKHQIQPHFLFNSLSTLKALIKTSPADAEEYLVKLSGFLRYSISSSEVNTIKIKEEVKLCSDYLAMQKIRFSEALQFTINIPADIMEQYYVPVFALQILVENAIKHNTFTMAAPLHISIEYASGAIAVNNNLQESFREQSDGGLGLANLRERYSILSKEDIIISKTSNSFSVSIKVLVHEGGNNRG